MGGRPTVFTPQRPPFKAIPKCPSQESLQMREDTRIIITMKEAPRAPLGIPQWQPEICEVIGQTPDGIQPRGLHAPSVSVTS